MSKRKITALAAVLLCILLLVPSIAKGLVGSVTAIKADKYATNYAINWAVMGGGGEPIASTHFALNSTIGQGVIGIESSDHYGVCTGYWCSEIGYRVYLPLVLRNYS